VLRVRVKIPVVRESTALGAAICAGVGVGVFPNPKNAAKQVVKWERVIEPNLDAARKYVKLYDQWTKVYRRMIDLVEDGLTQPMWRAAGT
jgi:autoinducer 2 (AI-2) kinase